MVVHTTRERMASTMRAGILDMLARLVPYFSHEEIKKKVLVDVDEDGAVLGLDVFRLLCNEAPDLPKHVRQIALTEMDERAWATMRVRWA